MTEDAEWSVYVTTVQLAFPLLSLENAYKD